MFWWQELGGHQRAQRNKGTRALLLYSTFFLLSTFLTSPIEILAIPQDPMLHVSDAPGPSCLAGLTTLTKRGL